MIGRQVKICTGFTQSIQILRRKKIKKIYCPMTAAGNRTGKKGTVSLFENSS